MFEAYAKGALGSDLLASTLSFDLIDCVNAENLKEWNLPLFDQKADSVVGKVKFET